jgi:hypothetical protein
MIEGKCREQLSEMRARGFEGTFSVSLEVVKNQVADISLIEAEPES